jgi:hypothetical protein
MPKKTQVVAHRKQPKPRPGRVQWSKITLGDIGSLASEGVKAARRLLNVEIKRLDNVTGTITPGTAGLLLNLSLIGQGDDWYQRNGLSVRTMALECRLTINVTAGGFQDHLRYILFSDTENNGANPAVTDVLEAATPRSPFNHLNTQRFQILHDEMLGVSTTGPALADRTIKMPLDCHLKYSAAAAAVASGREGQLFGLLIGDVNGATASTASHTSRVSYIDN